MHIPKKGGANVEFNLKKLRAKSGMTQVEVSEKSGVGRITISRFEKCYRYLSDYIRGFQDKQLAQRCILVFRRSGIQCRKHFNNSICINSSCIKCNEFNVLSGKNDDDFWRRCYIHRHLPVLFRVSNIQRNAHGNKADIAVRGCAV